MVYTELLETENYAYLREVVVPILEPIQQPAAKHGEIPV